MQPNPKVRALSRFARHASTAISSGVDPLRAGPKHIQPALMSGAVTPRAAHVNGGGSGGGGGGGDGGDGGDGHDDGNGGEKRLGKPRRVSVRGANWVAQMRKNEQQEHQQNN